MPKAAPAAPMKLNTWIIMLLGWNIALLAIAVFYLVKLSGQPLDLAAVAQSCSDAATAALTR